MNNFIYCFANKLLFSFEEIAESECCRLMDEALKYDQTNPEVYQTLANIRISQQKNDEALQLLHKNYSLWKDAG